MLSGSMVPRRSEARHGRGPRTKRGDVAIVGVGAVAPRAKDAQSLWQNVIAKTDAIRDLPASHFDVAKYLEPLLPTGAASPRLAGVVELPTIEPHEVKLPPARIQRLDRAVILSLAASHEALNSVGYDPNEWARRRVLVCFGQLPLRGKEIELDGYFVAHRFASA